MYEKAIGLPSIHQGIKGKAIMGDEEFVADALTKIKTDAEAGDLKEVPRMQRRAQAKLLSWYKENFLSQDEGIVSAYRSGDYTMKHIADKFKVHYSTVSRAIKKAESRKQKAEMHDCKTPFPSVCFFWFFILHKQKRSLATAVAIPRVSLI
jgi:putative transposase